MSYSPTSDALTIAGRIIPPSGILGGERFRVAFPPSATFGDDINGGLIPVLVSSKSATLTIGTIQFDAAVDVLLALLAEQQRLGGAKPKWAGTGVLVDGAGIGRQCSWANAWIEQSGEMSSQGSVFVSTWTLRLDEVVRA
jgi:hypothetical protein